MAAEPAVVLDHVELDREELVLVVSCPYGGGACATEELELDELDSVDELWENELDTLGLDGPVEELSKDELEVVVVVVTCPYGGGA